MSFSPTKEPGHREETPAPSLVELTQRLTRGRALDLACGAGRNALELARTGFSVEAWDRDAEALDLLQQRAAREGLTARITARRVDLETGDFSPPAGPFATIAVFRYLWRPLAPVLQELLLPGGTLVYETFVEHPDATDAPRNPLFRLRANELPTLFPALRVLLYRESLDERGRALALLLAARTE